MRVMVRVFEGVQPGFGGGGERRESFVTIATVSGGVGGGGAARGVVDGLERGYGFRLLTEG